MSERRRRSPDNAGRDGSSYRSNRNRDRSPRRRPQDDYHRAGADRQRYNNANERRERGYGGSNQPRRRVRYGESPRRSRSRSRSLTPPSFRERNRDRDRDSQNDTARARSSGGSTLAKTTDSNGSGAGVHGAGPDWTKDSKMGGRQDEPAEEQEPVDQDDIIAERRKRRLEILSRHHANGTAGDTRMTDVPDTDDKNNDAEENVHFDLQLEKVQIIPSNRPGPDNVATLGPEEEPNEAEQTEAAQEGDTADGEADSEDDMFASKSPVREGGPDGNGIVQAKELDQSMLDNWDDPQGYYRIIIGELLDGRYHVQASLGRGVFSNVVRAYDSVAEKLVAIKLIRNNDTMYKAGMKEIEILELLRGADPADKRHLIRLERHFDHKGHLCMVFEHLDINLREVLAKFGRYVVQNLVAVRTYAHQSFLALLLLRSTGVIHADIKPDNMLVNEEGNLLKLSDLGSAAYASEPEVTAYLVSRFYRAPEVILGQKPTFAIDMWAVGCTLYELYTGKILFTGKTNNDMLGKIMSVRGRCPARMVRKSPLGSTYFEDADEGATRFLSVEMDPISGGRVVKPVAVPEKPKGGLDLKSRLIPEGAGRIMSDGDLRELTGFVDLLERCLQLNPDKRIVPVEALRHPFITRSRG